MADYLLYLDRNETAYNEYLEWKWKGPDLHFIMLMDNSIVHSNCRFCIRAGDIDRKVIGEVQTGPFQLENENEMQRYAGTKAKSKIDAVILSLF